MKSELNILITDDNKALRETIKMVLKMFLKDAIIEEAENGQRAVDMTSTKKYDIVLMDISMPVLNGIDATAIIKKQNPELKVIGISMHTNQEDIEGIRDAGAAGYLVKDKLAQGLLDSIEKAMREEPFFVVNF
jgi:two-component system, NarL family, nitrate/nitrite response regulator NarL